MAAFASAHWRSHATTPSSPSSRPRLPYSDCGRDRRVTLSAIPGGLALCARPSPRLRRSCRANAVRVHEGSLVEIGVLLFLIGVWFAMPTTRIGFIRVGFDDDGF